MTVLKGWTMETEHSSLQPSRTEEATSPETNVAPRPMIASGHGLAKTLLALQRTVGNREVTALIQRLQQQTVLQRQPHRGAAPQLVVMHFTLDQSLRRQIHPHHLFQAATQLGMHSAEPGLTNVLPEYTTELDAQGRVIRVTMTVPVTVTLPEWPEASGLPSAAHAEWERFIRALTTHEDGHVAIIRRRLEHFGATLLHVTPDVAEQRWQANLAAMQQESDEYDAQTDHGRNNGTIIDTNVAGATVDVTAAPAGAPGTPHP